MPRLSQTMNSPQMACSKMDHELYGLNGFTRKGSFIWKMMDGGWENFRAVKDSESVWLYDSRNTQPPGTKVMQGHRVFSRIRHMTDEGKSIEMPGSEEILWIPVASIHSGWDRFFVYSATWQPEHSAAGRRWAKKSSCTMIEKQSFEIRNKKK